MNTTTKDHHLSHATTRPPLPKKMVALANEEEKKKMMAMKDDEVILTRSRLNNKVVTKILPNFLPSRSRSYHAPASEVKGNNLKTSPTNFFDKVGYENAARSWPKAGQGPTNQSHQREKDKATAKSALKEDDDQDDGWEKVLGRQSRQNKVVSVDAKKRSMATSNNYYSPLGMKEPGNDTKAASISTENFNKAEVLRQAARLSKPVVEVCTTTPPVSIKGSATKANNADKDNKQVCPIMSYTSNKKAVGSATKAHNNQKSVIDETPLLAKTGSKAIKPDQESKDNRPLSHLVAMRHVAQNVKRKGAKAKKCARAKVSALMHNKLEEAESKEQASLEKVYAPSAPSGQPRRVSEGNIAEPMVVVEGVAHPSVAEDDNHTELSGNGGELVVKALSRQVPIVNKGPTLGEEDARCRATSTTISQDAPVVVSAMRGADGTMTVSDGVKASFQQVLLKFQFITLVRSKKWQFLLQLESLLVRDGRLHQSISHLVTVAVLTTALVGHPRFATPQMRYVLDALGEPRLPPYQPATTSLVVATSKVMAVEPHRKASDQVNLACEVLCRKWHFFRAQVYLAAIKGCEQVCRLKLALLGALVTRVVGHPRYGLLTPRLPGVEYPPGCVAVTGVLIVRYKNVTTQKNEVALVFRGPFPCRPEEEANLDLCMRFALWRCSPFAKAMKVVYITSTREEVSGFFVRCHHVPHELVQAEKIGSLSLSGLVRGGSMALYDSIHKLEHGQDVTSLSRYHSQSVWMSLLLSQKDNRYSSLAQLLAPMEPAECLALLARRRHEFGQALLSAHRREFGLLSDALEWVPDRESALLLKSSYLLDIMCSKGLMRPNEKVCEDPYQAHIRMNGFSYCMEHKHVRPLAPVLLRLGARVEWATWTYETYIRLKTEEKQSMLAGNKKRPSWVKGKDAEQCGLCSSGFTRSSFLQAHTGRHHCRHCGIAVCGECSTMNTQCLRLPSFLRCGHTNLMDGLRE